MIVVIADDFSGAVEIGGVGHRFGLNVEVQTDIQPETKADLLVIDTNTRSLDSFEAEKIIRETCSHLPKSSEWIYKKTDSVLRGNVTTELNSLLKSLNKKSVLLIPANPSMSRVIKNGCYYINGIPLHQTDFSSDPETSFTKSDVMELLKVSDKYPLFLSEGSIPADYYGIIVGNSENLKQLRKWASLLEEEMIPAGGSDFFESLLSFKGYQEKGAEKNKPTNPTGKILMISGSNMNTRREFLKINKNQKPSFDIVRYKISDLNHLNNKSLKSWCQNCVQSLQNHGLINLMFETKIQRSRKLNQKLTSFTAELIYQILQEVSLSELVFEGGSTASAIVRRMGWKRFIPIQELTPGVVRIQEMSSFTNLTVKPGSYPWPKQIWNQNSN